MNKKYDAIDWQTFSQKKNIEEIVKNTKDKNTIQIVATVEIAMAVLSLLADAIFKDEIPLWFAFSTYTISIGVLLYLFVMQFIRWYKKNKPGADIPDLKTMIDLFDNDICYYVLMAESYLEKIEKINKSSSSNVEQFYFMETCFYINKAIYNLSLTSNCIDKLYSTDHDELYSSRKISYTRLKNIFNILDNIIKEIDSYYVIISNIDINNNYVELCKRYKEAYFRFKKLFSDIDKSI